MSDTPITEKAVTAGVQSLSDWLAACDIGLDEFERLGPLSATVVVRSILTAALPHLRADQDTETAVLRRRLALAEGTLAGERQALAAALVTIREQRAEIGRLREDARTWMHSADTARGDLAVQRAEHATVAGRLEALVQRLRPTGTSAPTAVSILDRVSEFAASLRGEQ